MTKLAQTGKQTLGEHCLSGQDCKRLWPDLADVTEDRELKRWGECRENVLRLQVLVLMLRGARASRQRAKTTGAETQYTTASPYVRTSVRAHTHWSRLLSSLVASGDRPQHWYPAIEATPAVHQPPSWRDVRALHRPTT